MDASRGERIARDEQRENRAAETAPVERRERPTTTLLSEAERELLRAWREARRPGRETDPVRRGLLDQWRTWRDVPSTQPPWAAALRYRFSDAAASPAPDTGLADERGYLAEAPSRVLGMLLSGAAGEALGQGRRGETGERTSATLFVLEGLVRAHASLRSDGRGDPVGSALAGLQRWLHTRGIAWEDCVPEPAAGGPDGWLVALPALRGSSSDDPAMLAALTRIAAGQPAGTRQRPSNGADSAGAVPIGPVAALWSSDPQEVFSLASDIAALTHGHSHGHHPAGVLAVTTSALLRGHSLRDSVEQGLDHWQSVPASVTRAVRLGRDSPPGFLPTREHVEAANAGRSGADSLAPRSGSRWPARTTSPPRWRPPPITAETRPPPR